ncbi:hypothetical protein Y695_04600 [Hydrogenophaga sp. T4]|nr:hypothetical protein Y695_04600 [Hydrogenophaga sp. T4]
MPATTATRGAYWAPSATVAICVLSPISARKNTQVVVANTPSCPLGAASTSSSLSGISIQPAMAMNETPSTQRITSGPTVAMTQAPTAPARAWLSSVATRMPQMMGQGLRNRAASTSESNWVLSPISARATMPVERRKASKTVLQGPEKPKDRTAAPALPAAVRSKVLPGLKLSAPWPWGPSVLTRTSAWCRAATPQ